MNLFREALGFSEVGTGYFDAVAEVISAGTSSTKALGDSTEAHQF